jgi:hypothetical protein
MVHLYALPFQLMEESLFGQVNKVNFIFILEKQISSYDTSSIVVTADINAKLNVLALGLKNGTIKFYSIAKF